MGGFVEAWVELSSSIEVATIRQCKYPSNFHLNFINKIMDCPHMSLKYRSIKPQLDPCHNYPFHVTESLFYPRNKYSFDNHP